MEKALRVYGWYGFLNEEIKATEIKSRADARKLAPFASHDDKQVLWVNWTWLENNNRWKKAYFRHYPSTSKRNQKNLKDVSQEISDREIQKKKSNRHDFAQKTIAKYLSDLVAQNKPFYWNFVDKRVSPFTLSGDLLSEVVEVRTEYPIHTPFGNSYRLDIALLGEPVATKPLLLGGIELEFNHEFEMLKCLLCKSAGIPLVSLDLNEIGKNEINEKWCIETLNETTSDSRDSRRRNYVYIHNMLYPLYMDIQRACSSHLDRHQYIIFVKDEQFDDLLRWLNNLKQCLSLYNNEVLIQPQPCTNAQTLKIMENEGSIAGHDWRDYNEKRYIRVSLDKPKKKSGPLYKYHLVMANLLSSHCEALVGYKNRLGISNDDPNNPLWDVLIKDDNDKIKKVNFLPKHVSEPVSSILKALDKLEK